MPRLIVALQHEADDGTALGVGRAVLGRRRRHAERAPTRRRQLNTLPGGEAPRVAAEALGPGPGPWVFRSTYAPARNSAPAGSKVGSVSRTSSGMTRHLALGATG